MMRFNLIFYIGLVIFSAACSRTAPQSADEGTPEKVKTEKYEGISDGKSAEDGDTDKESYYREQKEAKENAAAQKNCYYLGLDAHNAGNFSEAISHFNTCLDSDQDQSNVLYARGMSKYKSGDKNGACSDWRKAGELGDSNAPSMVQQYCN